MRKTATPSRRGVEPPTLTSTATDLAAALEPIRAKSKLPALAAAAWRGNELLAIGATGLRAKGSDARVTIDDRFHLGSDTKAMTAVLTAIWIDRGKLSFDDTLGTIFGDDIHDAYRPVTIEQLLQHRGGLPHQFPARMWASMWRAGSKADARSAAIRAVLARSPSQAPGTFQYSNTGYVTLGAALERATGRQWEDLMRADLFAPLGMTTAGFGAPDEPAPRGHRRGLFGYASVSERTDNPPSSAPAGGVHCALADWGKFLALVLAGARGEQVTLVSDASMKRLLEVPNESRDGQRYAGGWSFTHRSWAGGTALTHAGSNTLWMALAWIAPAKNLTFVAVANAPDSRAVDAAFATTIPRYA